MDHETWSLFMSMRVGNPDLYIFMSFCRGDNMHAAGLVGPSYRRRPIHEDEPPVTPARATAVKSPRPARIPAQNKSNLTRYLLILLGMIIITFVVYFILNSDPFDSNPVITMGE